MKHIIYIALLVLFTACSDFLEDYSQDLVVPKTVSDLNEVLLGSGYLPSDIVKELRSGTIGWWLHILDDDINMVMTYNAVKGFQDVNSTYYGYYTWQYEVGRNYDGTSLAGDNALWDGLYNRINAMNIILNELGNVSQDSKQEQLDALTVQGECLFLRAQFYLVLVNVYANAYDPATAPSTYGVPLKLTHYVEHDKNKDTQFERTSVANVYAQIVDDLKISIDCFKQSPQSRSFYRASEEAARLLLSRVYLYMQDWTNAREAAKDFLAVKGDLYDYNSIADSTTVTISENSNEVLFSQGSLSLQSDFTGHGGDFCVSQDLYQLYDTLDCRRELYFSRSYQSDSLGLWRKYEMGVHRSYVSDFWILRTAEGYLNMAEACAMLDDPATASEYLNHLRRYRIDGYRDTIYSADNIVEAVREERRKELCFEGHRWFDLRRYAVCKKAPSKKVIKHMFSIYDWDHQNLFKYGEVYLLEEDDLAYTFAIPKSVLEFDTGMPDNLREQRKYSYLVYRRADSGGDNEEEIE